ncbi:hypothetical protein Ate01nite_00690 [Actinoplanes teichomyceticus]|nr:hypothetical protein Ate01nite_00690 [Actinoplanes teichomyceticus]
MTAPGNSAILLLLLTGFVGCAGYALGRLHERRQGGAEREEAYLHGYDHAARSVFSLAVRAAVPRRRGAVRASAVVGDRGRRSRPGGPPAADAPSAPVPAGRSPDLSAAGAGIGRSPGSAAEGATGRSPDLSGAGAGIGRSPGSAAEGATAPAGTVPGAAPAGPVPGAAPAGPVPGAAPAGGAAIPVDGFPAPAPYVVPSLPAPAAEGGVRYSVLPDPRWSRHPDRSTGESSGAGAGPPAGTPLRAPREPCVPRARLDPDPLSEPERAGRHTVPDELVRAATYRLAADRVARARVGRPPAGPTSPVQPGPPAADAGDPDGPRRFGCGG